MNLLRIWIWMKVEERRREKKQYFISELFWLINSGKPFCTGFFPFFSSFWCVVRIGMIHLKQFGKSEISVFFFGNIAWLFISSIHLSIYSQSWLFSHSFYHSRMRAAQNRFWISFYAFFIIIIPILLTFLFFSPSKSLLDALKEEKKNQYYTAIHTISFYPPAHFGLSFLIKR